MQNSGSIWNGDSLADLYNIMDVGNQVVQKGIVRVLTGIATKRALPKTSQTSKPLGVYTTGAPTSDTVTTTYSERTVEPKKMMLYEEDLPENFFDIFPDWQAVGDLTNLRSNPELMMVAIQHYFNNAGTHMSELFWAGDTSLASSTKMHYFDGIITRLKADPNCIAVTPAGVITKANVVDRVEEVWASIPDKFIDDPDFGIYMNTTDYKLLQQYNNDAKKTTVGVLSEDIQNLFLNKRIMHFSGLTKDHIVAAKGIADSSQSNLFLAYWVPLEAENPNIDKVDNSGKTWFTRLDVKADANYRVAEEIVFYEPS